MCLFAISPARQPSLAHHEHKRDRVALAARHFSPVRGGGWVIRSVMLPRGRMDVKWVGSVLQKWLSFGITWRHWSSGTVGVRANRDAMLPKKGSYLPRQHNRVGRRAVEVDFISGLCYFSK